MDTLTAARWQMEVSLGFHMIFAAVGMAMPLMMLIAEGRYLRTGDLQARRLARTWAKATAVLFAIGAVSGTALAFELGLLWPRFMALAGAQIGIAFTLEGYAFFVEAIFLGLYLYGWDRLSPRAHWLAGVPVALAGAASGILVLAANAWMQHPVGFTPGPDGLPASVDPLATLLNPAWPPMALHSTLSTYQAVGFATAGVYAWALLKDRRPDPDGERGRYNRLAVVIAMAIGTAAAVVQPFAGDLLAKRAHVAQPAKLAAMEGQFRTERNAPLRIGGIPDPATGETRWAIEIPSALSILATGDPNGEVTGLDAFPPDQRPPVVITHLAFQVMVGGGLATLAAGAWFAWSWWRGRRAPHAPGWAASRPLLWALVLASPLGFIALEAGWIVTEVGRQPWVVYEVLRTRDAVTPVADVGASLAGFVLLYAALAVALVVLLRRLSAGHHPGDGHDAPQATERPAPQWDPLPAP